MALVVGVDSSTQSTKVEIRDTDTGTVVATGRAPHPPTTPPVSEQDPERWWAALIDATTQAVTSIGPRRHEIAAMAIAGQQHGLVLVDAADRVIRPAVLWNDTTAAPDAAALVERLGPAEWAQRCGSVPLAAFTIAKLARLHREEPASLQRTARVMLPHDYLTWRCTGRHVTDRGDASGTGWFDPATDTYRPDLLTTALDDSTGWTDHLPTVLGPLDAAGPLTASAAEALGLDPAVVVGPGTGDNMAAALGLGLTPGDVAISLGTSGTVYGVSPAPGHDPSGAVAGFADATGHFLPLVCTLNATKVTDTVARLIGTDPAGLAELASTAAPGPAEVVVVPYFDGERTPHRPDASGSILGLRTDTDRAALARAAHDGVLCGLLDGLDALHATGLPTDGVVHLVGGGARSAAYRQRAADLLGAPVRVPRTDETVAAGAAVQAWAVVGPGDFDEVADAWGLRHGDDIDPVDPDGAHVRAAHRAAVDAPLS